MTIFTDLLRPVEGPAPCGPDLSFSPEFDAIQDMRRADDPSLSQGEWITELKSADWPGVAAACDDLLRTRTKDLRLVSALAEAWAHLRGYAGLADGIALAQALCEQQWPTLHPQPDGSDFELRVGALSRLLGQVASLVPVLPVLQTADASYSLRDMEAARALQAMLSKASDPSAVPTAGKVTPEEVQKALRETPAAVISERLAHCRRARAALEGLQTVVDGHLGVDGPAFAAARAALDDGVHTLDRLARGVGGATGAGTSASTAAGGAGQSTGSGRSGAAQAANAAQTAAAGAAAGSGGGQSGGPPSAGAQAAHGEADANAATGAPDIWTWQPGMPATRTQALEQLRLVGEFFRRTEPHSPVAYLAERAATWGELPLHDWLRLVIKDSGALGQLEELLGVPPKPRTDD